jgi:hypothetical protein
MKDVTAVMDAATLYGANRWLLGLHDNPDWSFRDSYRAADDQRAFNEFLHDLVLYDHIILDNTSITNIGSELDELFLYINQSAGDQLISFQKIATIKADEFPSIMIAVASLLEQQARNGEDLAKLVAYVPWAYHGLHHKDAPEMRRAAQRVNLNEALLPLALFLFRGVCYAGFANSLAREQRRPVAYVASPGRIQAMEVTLSQSDMKKMKYPREAYADLVERLNLPPTGYDFSFLDSFSTSMLSPLALALSNEKPRRALRSVLEWRALSEARALRKEWAERIFDYRVSAAIGATINQKIINSHISGDVQQVIRGIA